MLRHRVMWEGRHCTSGAHLHRQPDKQYGSQKQRHRRRRDLEDRPAPLLFLERSMPDQDPAQTATDPAAQAAAGTTNPAATTTDPAAQAATDLESLPAWAQQTIKDLRKEQASRRKAAQEAEAATKAAEDRQLAERQEWQKLAEQRAAELANLTPVAERYAALSSEITAQIEAEIKTWPAEVIALRPADADAVALMTWAKTARPLAAKLTTAGQPPAPGQGQTPKPAGQASRADANRQQAATAQVRSRF